MDTQALNDNARAYADSASRVMSLGRREDSPFARNLVLSTLSELFRWEYRGTPWASGELISIGPWGISGGAREYGYLEIGHVGLAGIVADGSSDLPTATLEGDYHTSRIFTVATSIYYSTQDIRASREQGFFDIASEKVAAAREAHDRLINDLIVNGDASLGLSGVLTIPGLSVVATTGDWATTATAAQIVADFGLAWSAIFDETDAIENPDAAVFPAAVWTRLTTLINSTSSDITVLDFLKRSYPGISLWTYDPSLPSDTAVVYSRDKNRLRVVMPLSLQPLPLVQDGLQFRMAFESRFGGVMSPKPKSRALLTGI